MSKHLSFKDEVGIVLGAVCMPRKSAKTDIRVDRFWPADIISELAEEARKETQRASRRKYKSIVLRFDALHAMRLIIALQKVIEHLENVDDKISLTTYIDEKTTHESLRMTVTAADR